MKSLRVKFSNGETYDIPAEVIADHRAKYYADADYEKDKKINYAKVLKEERDFALKDDYELIDWAFDNMDWEDVESSAKHVASDSSDTSKHKEWSNASHEIVES